MSRRRRAGSRPPDRHAHDDHTRPSQTASLRVSAARPMSTPRPMSRGSVSRAPCGSRRMRVISRQAPSTMNANSAVESGQRRVEDQRQVHGARSGPRRGRACGPGRRQPALLGDVRREPPGEDRDERADEDRGRPAPPRSVVPKIAIGIAARKVGSGSQTSKAGPREAQRRRLEAPERVGDQAAALDEVARDADVVGGVLGLGKTIWVAATTRRQGPRRRPAAPEPARAGHRSSQVERIDPERGRGPPAS